MDKVSQWGIKVWFDKNGHIFKLFRLPLGIPMQSAATIFFGLRASQEFLLAIIPPVSDWRKGGERNAGKAVFISWEDSSRPRWLFSTLIWKFSEKLVEHLSQRHNMHHINPLPRTISSQPKVPGSFNNANTITVNFSILYTTKESFLSSTTIN